MDRAQALFNALEDRGRHASGVAYAWVDSDRWLVEKDACAASSLVWRDAVGNNNVQALMFHTRYTTQGSTENNGNNHPIVEHDHILTHNGVLRNDGLIFDNLGVKRNQQVDSEALNALLNVGGIEMLADAISGSCSIAWINNHYEVGITPEEINLFTNGLNPLVIARTTCGSIVYASGIHHIEQAFDVVSSFNAVPFKHYTINFNGLIESEFVSDERRSARVIYGRSNEHPAGGTRTPQNVPSRASQSVVFGGMRYDPETDCWKKWRN